MNTLSRRSLLRTVAAGAAAAASNALWAQAYPHKPITLVVGFPAGGDTDIIGRLIAEKIGAALSTSVVVDNRAGAAGTIAANFVRRSAADGYTLLLAPKTFVSAPLVLGLPPNAKYHPAQDFAPVALVASQPLVLVGHPERAPATAQAMFDQAKAGKAFSYATPGAGSPPHIVGEWLNQAAKVRFTHVPYRGVAPAMNDLVAGHVDLAWVPYGVAEAYLGQRRIVALATCEPARFSLAPNLPTLQELGYAVSNSAWNAVFAAKDTPRPILDLLNAQINAATEAADVVEKFRKMGALPMGGPPSRLQQSVNADNETLGRVVAELKITAN